MICLSGVVCHDVEEDDVVVFVCCLSYFVVSLSQFKSSVHGDVVSGVVVIVVVVFSLYCIYRLYDALGSDGEHVRVVEDVDILSRRNTRRRGNTRRRRRGNTRRRRRGNTRRRRRGNTRRRRRGNIRRQRGNTRRQCGRGGIRSSSGSRSCFLSHPFPLRLGHNSGKFEGRIDENGAGDGFDRV